jgi:hypothetical protein
MTSLKKYQKYLSKYLKGAGINYHDTVKLFENQFSSKAVKVNELADLNGVTVISVSVASDFDAQKLPDSFRGVKVRKSINN